MKQIQVFRTKRSSSVGMDTCTEAAVPRSSQCRLDVDDLLARIDSALRERRIR